ncbi:MAG: hypothetical protein JWO31_3106, partial [Phycisphaerales bacterium]|nr:hypothetical protein [Phycisphaerales bacterium]
MELVTDPAFPLDPASPEADGPPCELAMERLRRRVYESVARQELLSHTLRSLVLMVEREAPRVSACLLVPAADARPSAGPTVIAGRLGDPAAAAALTPLVAGRTTGAGPTPERPATACAMPSGTAGDGWPAAVPVHTEPIPAAGGGGALVLLTADG